MEDRWYYATSNYETFMLVSLQRKIKGNYIGTAISLLYFHFNISVRSIPTSKSLFLGICLSRATVLPARMHAEHQDPSAAKPLLHLEEEDLEQAKAP